ncbi:MAG: twin-arginine translocase TatA/TatE family subunit [Deltaproteobacteria bacterium]|nr:twin-arginine translocase TatA/TatE family subunit [Deltaproteobacteria bacterium]
MGNIGATELVLIILVALLLFGASRIAGIGRGLGEGIRNFKKGLLDDERPGADPPQGPPEPEARLRERGKGPARDEEQE